MMTARPIPLNGLSDHEDLSPAINPNPPLRLGWRLPKRWLWVLTVTCGLSIILYSFSGIRLSYSDTQQHTPPRGPSSPVPYLLGKEEDLTKLWFPPSQQSTTFQPSVASYNIPPPTSHRPRTPLFIAFTRNNAMLQQNVLSYIAAGWPREDIIIVDNSGTMDANPLRLLSLTNPFFLDYDLLRQRYGVSVLQTPTLLNFAQLMNFFLRVSLAHNWHYFFWSHMDVAILSDEEAMPYKSFYMRVLDILANLGINNLDSNPGLGESDKWAVKHFRYDWLTLVNVAAWRKIGTWDTFIPYYTTDCDAYARVVLNGFTLEEVQAGRIFDLCDIIEDPERKFFPSSSASTDSSEDVGVPNSQRYHTLLTELQDLNRQKTDDRRNSWQVANKGGKGEPWTYDPKGFQKMWWATAENGRGMYKVKWGTQECGLEVHGFQLDDAWKEKEGN